MAYATVYEKVDKLEKAFYTNLQTCTAGDFQSRYTYGWHIYGQKDGKCSFENKDSAVDMKCLLPMNMAKKYALEALKVYQVSEQKGFAPGSDYINKINNDKNYCTMTWKHKK